MKIYEGNIISCDAHNNVWKYLVEDQGKIIYTGNNLPEKYNDVQKIELGNRALIPSFASSKCLH